jgi:hypothetical protein
MVNIKKSLWDEERVDMETVERSSHRGEMLPGVSGPRG